MSSSFDSVIGRILFYDKPLGLCPVRMEREMKCFVI